MSPLHRIRRQVAGVLLPLILLSACEGEPIGGGAMARPFGRAIYGVTTDNQLVVFGSTNPDSISRQVTISGLAGGESIVGIDFGPRDGRLYAVGMGGRIFTLDSVSGAATQVGATPFTPAPSGSAFGVDFNPVPNQIRLHSNQTQNLRLNQLTGAVGATDTALTYMAGDPNAGTTPTVAGTAYTVFIGDTTATKLYAIDSNLDLLATLPSPNSGRLTTIGVLGVTTNDNVGFDIAPALPGSTGTAYASLTQGANGPSRLYTINLMTGAAALVGTIGVSPALRGIAVAP